MTLAYICTQLTQLPFILIFLVLQLNLMHILQSLCIFISAIIQPLTHRELIRQIRAFIKFGLEELAEFGNFQIEVNLHSLDHCLKILKFDSPFRSFF